MTDITPVDRDTAMGTLSQRAAAGGMTLGEYAERAAVVTHATGTSEIESALANGAAATPATRHRGMIVGILGGSEQRGRWRLPRRLGVVALFGGASLDMSSAEPEAPETVITALAAFGGVEIIAPPGVPITLTGIALLGGKADARPAGMPLPGAPVIRVRVLALFGGVKVKAPATD